jgi:hypothetical protein
LSEYTNKITQCVFRHQAIRYWNYHLDKSVPSVTLLDENTATYHYSMIFNRFDEKTPIFMKIVNELVPSGIIQKLEQDRNSIRMKKVEESEPQKLTMDHLGVCFAAVMICLGFGCLVFAIECLTSFVKDRMNLHQ